MKKSKIRSTGMALLALFLLKDVAAQNLSFSTPVKFFTGATSSKAIDITKFNKHFFVSWTDATDGSIHAGHLGDQDSSISRKHDDIIPGASSNYGPVLRYTANRIYVFWISKTGSLQYAFNTSDTGFTNSVAYTLDLANTPVGLGVTVALSGNNIVIGTHAPNKGDLLYCTTTMDADGKLTSKGLKKIPAKSADYPFVVGLSDSVARFVWRGYRDMNIYYADVNIFSSGWTDEKQVYESETNASPALFKVFESDKLFYIWKGGKKDNRLYYTTELKGKMPAAETTLPPDFSTQNATAICTVDNKKFLLAFTGLDNQLYFSYFINYDPARWMEQMLFPAKGHYSLRDIVIPGAHDAGMSVLTATGGQQSGTINECNTLTQIQNIQSQLNSGIRMFDLRVGFYDSSYYAKHCSADCMADAIGGGYGEKLSTILYSIRDFLKVNTKETIICSFSHFCEREAPAAKVAKFIMDSLGRELIFSNNGKSLGEITLNEVAGRAIISFEQFATPDKMIDSCSIAGASKCFLNFKREYAATNVLTDLHLKEKNFFTQMNTPLNHNDLVRLDWQLTQSADEAAMICNDFENEKIDPLINGAMLLTNIITKHKSIRDLSLGGNQSMLMQINGWISDGVINKKNKPNILYVDMAGGWVTDYCVQLNNKSLYQK